MDEFQKLRHIGEQMERDLLWDRKDQRPEMMYIQCGICGEIILYDRRSTALTDRMKSSICESCREDNHKGELLRNAKFLF